MPDKKNKFSDLDKRNLKAIMDRLIPPVGELPGAGSIDLIKEVEKMSFEHDRFKKSVFLFLEALSLDMSVQAFGGLMAIPDDQKDNIISEIETVLPEIFKNFLEVVYLAYYQDTAVHKHIGWATGPLQPNGFMLQKFDETILRKIREREPFWRKV